MHHELAPGDIWIIASDLLQAIQSRGTAKAGLSCDQQLHYFIPLASVAAGLEVPRRWARASLFLGARNWLLRGCTCPAGGAFARWETFSANAYTWLQPAWTRPPSDCGGTHGVQASSQVPHLAVVGEDLSAGLGTTVFL